MAILYSFLLLFLFAGDVGWCEMPWKSTDFLKMNTNHTTTLGIFLQKMMGDKFNIYSSSASEVHYSPKVNNSVKTGIKDADMIIERNKKTMAEGGLEEIDGIQNDFKKITNKNKIISERLRDYERANQDLSYDPSQLYWRVKHLHDSLNDHPLYYSLLSHEAFQVLVSEVSTLSQDTLGVPPTQNHVSIPIYTPNIHINTVFTNYDSTPIGANTSTTFLNSTFTSPVITNSSSTSLNHMNNPFIITNSTHPPTETVNTIFPPETTPESPISSNLFKVVSKLHHQLTIAEPVVHNATSMIQEVLPEKSMDEDAAIDLLQELLPMMKKNGSTPEESVITETPSSTTLYPFPDPSSSLSAHDGSAVDNSNGRVKGRMLNNQTQDIERMLSDQAQLETTDHIQQPTLQPPQNLNIFPQSDTVTRTLVPRIRPGPQNPMQFPTRPTFTISPLPEASNDYSSSILPEAFDRLSLLFAQGSTTQPPITTTIDSEPTKQQLQDALYLLAGLQDIFNSQQRPVQSTLSTPLQPLVSLQTPQSTRFQVSVSQRHPGQNQNSEFVMNIPGTAPAPLPPPPPIVPRPPNTGSSNFESGVYSPYGSYSGYPRYPNNQYPPYSPYPYPYPIPPYICQGGGASTSTSTGPGSAAAAASAGGGCSGGSTSTSTSGGQSAGAAPGSVSVGTNGPGSGQIAASPNPTPGRVPDVRPPGIPIREDVQSTSPPTRPPPFSIRFGTRSTTTTPAPQVTQEEYTRVVTALSTLMKYLNRTNSQPRVTTTTAAPNAFSVSADLYIPILSELLRRTTTTTTPSSPSAVTRPLLIVRPHARPRPIGASSNPHIGDQSIQELLQQGYTSG